MPTQLTRDKNKSQLLPAAVHNGTRGHADNTLFIKDFPPDPAVQQKPTSGFYENDSPSDSVNRDEFYNPTHLFNYLNIQPKLTVGAPDDEYEREADQVAQTVMQMPDPNMGRQPLEEEEGEIKAKPLGRNLTPLVQIQRSTLKNRSKIGRMPVVVALRAQPQIFRAAVLSSTGAARAVQYNNQYYDPKSIIIIENIVNVPADGHFSLSDAQAVATYQKNNIGLVTDGMVGENTLNVMVPELAQTGAHSEAISLVGDYYNVNRQEVLSMRYDANITGTRTSFESGYLRVIRIGPQAFRSATDLLNAISNTMLKTAPGHMAMHVPRRLSRTQVRGAIRANKMRFQDTRSILAIQELVQAPISGVIDADTNQNIAEFQYNRGLTQNPDGRIDSRGTLQAMVSELIGRRHYNSVIRLIIDYYNLSTHGALLDISFGLRTTLAGWIPGTTTLRIGQVWFGRSFSALVHQIANMLDRVRTRKAGILDRAVRIFLGEAVEIQSIGTPEESFPNFMIDARRALVNWNNMSRQDRRRYWMRFHHVRQKVYQRYSSATLAQRRANSWLLRAYFNVIRP